MIRFSVILLVGLATGLLAPVEAQIPPKIYPKVADLGLSGVFLNLRQSSEDVLGPNIILSEESSKQSVHVCQNVGGSEEAHFVHHHGRGEGTFQEFRVRQVLLREAALPQEPLGEHGADSVSVADAKATEVLKSDLEEPLAETDLVETPTPSVAFECILDVEQFVSARGVKLGMSLGQLTKEFGNAFSVDSQLDRTVLTYSMQNNLSSDFLRHYQALSYFGRYYFHQGRLVEFSFGIDNL